VPPFNDRVLELLPTYGPWVLFALTFLETSFVTGMVVPAGVATSMGVVLALEGELDLAHVVVAVLLGGAAGDTAGYWVGWFFGERVVAGEGWWGRLLRRRDPALDRWYGRNPAYSVTFARLISFVRTLMPMAAGVSGIGYSRFLAWDLLGVVGYLAIYAGVGYLARESWEVAARVVGVGGAAVFLAISVGVWVVLRRRGRARRAAAAGRPTGKQGETAC
jgi:membrane protein DedA with SNARE-associated domain